MTKYFAGLLIALITLKLGNMIADHLIHVEPLEKMSYIVAVQEERSKPSPQEEKVQIEPITPLLAKASAEEGKKIAGRCSQCHSFDKNDPHKLGPNLHAVVGSTSGSKTGYTYSDAMKNKKTTWDPENLNFYLYDPKAFIPGTKMAFAGLKNDAERANLIAYLSTLNYRLSLNP